MEKSGKFRLTSLERNWILYDVGNSAFVLMVATLIPIFFNALAESGGLSSVEYLAYWGYASSAVTIITAVLSPILGTVADTKGFKKPIFILCVFVGIVGCCAMGAASAWLPFLVIFVIAKVGFSGSLVFYDSMLSDVTTPERMDEVSSRGYAWGYIGSCVPFVVCLGLVLGAGSIGISQMTALNLALLLTAAWWLLTTLTRCSAPRPLPSGWTGVQPGLCIIDMGIQLRALRGLSRPCAGGGEHRHQPDDGAESGTPADGGVVAAHDPAAAEKL